MSKLTKNQKAVMAKYDHTKVYTLAEACGILKDITYTKFDASVEISANLGVINHLITQKRSVKEEN